MYDEAVRMLAAFSRFEHALKKEGFVDGAVGGPAVPAWDRFARKLGKPFFERVAEAGEARLLFEAPPKQQSVEAPGRAYWKDKPAPRDAADVLASVRRIRNNLFHGEKDDPNAGRDIDLLKAALFVLTEARKRAGELPELRKVADRLPEPP